MNKRLQGTLILALAALVWGISFVSQSESMNYIEPNTFNGIRTLLGCISLLPVILVLDMQKKKKDTYTPMSKTQKTDLIKGGIACGIFLCIASTIQTYGLKYTTAGKSGFITALYMIFVPIVSVFLGKKIRPAVVISILIALVGMYFLCIKKGSFEINKGDVLTLICSIVFTFHILTIDHFSAKVDGVRLSCMQFLVGGTINTIIMFLFENPQLDLILKCTIPILYSGLMSCGVAYTFQIIGQKYAEPTVASLVMSLESVFAAIAGWILLSEAMDIREITGCALMFAAIVLVQLPEKQPDTAERE
ncbi:MAG: DMT family transporter [Clostridia bacterium]|nr:DMT family transporter [Clostridia bacterium]